MAVLATILPVVSRSSALALELYRVAAESPKVAKEFIKVASVINGFASILKQVGTIIKEDDRLPSPEATETLEDVINQSETLLASFQSTTCIDDDQDYNRRDSARFTRVEHPQTDSNTTARLDYLTAHLEALSMTLSVLLQTLYTAQSIMWSKLRPTVSPQQAAKAVASEKVQLETLIIQQQLSIIAASNIYEQAPQLDVRFLMEEDSSQSLVVADRDEAPRPSSLHPYQDRYLASLDTSASSESERMPAVCSIASSRAERLLVTWTSLPQFERRLQDEEREARRQKQENLQATVESDSEEEQSRSSKLSGDGARRTRRSGSVQPLFTDAADANSPPLPVPVRNYGPAAPPTPVASPHTSRSNIPMTANDQYSAASPRSSIGSLPVEAAAAMEAKEDNDVDLEIPWVLCTRKYYWKFVDAKQVSSNTDQASSLAFLERNSWTEIMASWVCKEAIREAGYPVTQVQKERKDGRRTKFETCFCIERPLQFDQVKHLVERTVELYRQTAPPTPPRPHVMRPSYQRLPPPPNAPKVGVIDRDRTPVPRNTHPGLDRSNSSMHFPPPPPGPPPLDRSMSMPGPGLAPPPPSTGVNTRPVNLQIPGQYPPRPQSPRSSQHPPQPNSYSAQPINIKSAQWAYPPPPPLSGSLPPQFQNQNYPAQQSPLRQSYHNSSYANRKYDDDFTTSDSEPSERERTRRRRSKSRGRYREDREGKKRHSGRKAAGALLGVGGLTALLDGLSGF